MVGDKAMCATGPAHGGWSQMVSIQTRTHSNKMQPVPLFPSGAKSCVRPNTQESKYETRREGTRRAKAQVKESG